MIPEPSDSPSQKLLKLETDESGNMLVKQLEYMGHADSAGIVMGARVPIVLTSRADSRRTRLASCAIALLLAHRFRTAPP